MNTQNPERRSVLRAAAWAMPVVALSATAPLAAASTPGELYCRTDDPDVRDVRVSGSTLWITFHSQARNSVDVTIRVSGHAEIHYNFVPTGTPTNGVPHMRNYSPGEVVSIPLPRAYSIASGDWMQVKTIHNENCVVL